MLAVLQGLQVEQAPHTSVALGQPVFAPVQLDGVPSAAEAGVAPAVAGGQPPLEHTLQLNGGVFLPPRTARGPRREQSSADDEGSSAAATDGSEATHAWVRSLPRGMSWVIYAMWQASSAPAVCLPLGMNKSSSFQ